MSFGKMAALLFGLAGVLAMVNFAVLPSQPDAGATGADRTQGHVIVTHAQGENPAENANRGLEAARARRAAVPVDFGAVPADPATAMGAPDVAPLAAQPGAGAPTAPANQPPAPRSPPVQAAPPVSFVPGLPMVDTNPSR